MTKQSIIKIYLCGLTFFNSSFAAKSEEVLPANNAFQQGLPVTQILHNFWIKFSEAESKSDYEIGPSELISLTSPNAMMPDIRIIGSVVVESPVSAGKCYVRLPSNILKAKNSIGEEININIRGTISNQILSTEFVKPEFDSFNEARFIIEGFIDRSSFLKGLSPGEYEYKDNLNLIVEFR